jgi:hypothetical protein
MRGVNQLLMGISDTGDVQMMQPNQDYHFKGSRVTELPMALYGVSQQNDRDGSQLEQLQNFTNYNKKAKNGKWLEKYS